MKLKEIYAYESGVTQAFDFEPGIYVDIAEEEPLVEEKRVQARYRGMQSGLKYAEAFKFIAPHAPLRTLLSDLLEKEMLNPQVHCYIPGEEGITLNRLSIEPC